MVGSDDHLQILQEFYTPLKAQGKAQQLLQQGKRKHKLRVVLQEAKQQQSGAKGGEQLEEGQPQEVLQGLRNYAQEHTLLVG